MNEEIKAFRTLDEYFFALQLEELKIDYTYEQESFVLDKAFKDESTGKTYRDMKYTPDFIFTHNKQKYAIEIKGYSLFDKPIKYRLAYKLFSKSNIKFYRLNLRGAFGDGTKAFYDQSKGVHSTKLASKYQIKNRLFKAFFYENNINTHDYVLKPLKQPKKHTFEGITKVAMVEWYKEHLDNSEISEEFLNDFISNNYIRIGTKNKHFYINS